MLIRWALSLFSICNGSSAFVGEASATRVILRNMKAMVVMVDLSPFGFFLFIWLVISFGNAYDSQIWGAIGAHSLFPRLFIESIGNKEFEISVLNSLSSFKISLLNYAGVDLDKELYNRSYDIMVVNIGVSWMCSTLSHIYCISCVDHVELGLATWSRCSSVDWVSWGIHHCNPTWHSFHDSFLCSILDTFPNYRKMWHFQGWC